MRQKVRVQTLHFGGSPHPNVSPSRSVGGSLLFDSLRNPSDSMATNAVDTKNEPIQTHVQFPLVF